MAPPTKRKGRPLLAAAAGVAFVSFAGCQVQEPRPVGNLRAPDAPLPVAGTDAVGGSSSAGAPTSGGSGAEPPIAPVGNLRPPEPPADEPKPKPTPPGTVAPPHPVGNLRPPDTK